MSVRARKLVRNAGLTSAPQAREAGSPTFSRGAGTDLSQAHNLGIEAGASPAPATRIRGVTL